MWPTMSERPSVVGHSGPMLKQWNYQRPIYHSINTVHNLHNCPLSFLKSFFTNFCVAGLLLESVYFKVLTSWSRGRVALNTISDNLNCGRVARSCKVLFSENILGFKVFQGFLGVGAMRPRCHEGKLTNILFAATQPGRENFEIDTPFLLQYLFTKMTFLWT